MSQLLYLAAERDTDGVRAILDEEPGAHEARGRAVEGEGARAAKGQHT